MVEYISFVVINIFGVISPGPDFAVVSRYGLSGSRQAALQATLGVTCALFIHVLFCVSGVAFFLQSSPNLLILVRFIGAFYLAYLGLQILISSQKEATLSEKPNLQKPFTAGFFTNLLNPKAMIFLFSLFTLYANAMDTLTMKFIFALSIPLIAMGWFSLVSISITHPIVLPLLQKRQKLFMSLMSLLLILLSGVAIYSSVKDFMS